MKDLHSRFGFHTTPFTREISHDCRFSLPLLDDPVNALERVIERRMSGALIAPAGTGKTSVLRALAARLPEARYRVRYIKVTCLARRDMCREIASATGCAPAGNFPALVRRLQEHLLQVADTDGLRPVLLVDEAHETRPEVLGLFRLLTNFHMDSRLVLSLVLCGQPPLRTLLSRDDMEDVARRMALYESIRPLTREETRQYIEHRCSVAGSPTLPFDERATDAIFEIGRGNMRATDNLGLESLQLAHQADLDSVGYNHVAEARRRLWP